VEHQIKRHPELKIVPYWTRFLVYRCIFSSNYFLALVYTWWELLAGEIAAPNEITTVMDVSS